jgi:hypothetical protein
MNRTFLLMCSLFALLPACSMAQEEPKHFKSIGGLSGYGKEFSDNVDYKTWFFMADISRSFRKPKKKVFLAWYAQPQFNLVKATNTPKNAFDSEFGLNLGIRNYIRVNPGFYFYQMLGSGPHYISADLERQATGFIFSDNLMLGSLIRLKKQVFLNLQFGIRHISNANINLPNRGVNSLIFMVGISGLD